jgi:osmotically-inducible protein OsmY
MTNETKEIEMGRHNPIYTLAFGAIFAGVLGGCANLQQRGSQASADAKITTDVEASLNQMAALGPPGSIKVQTMDHVVYLNGLVDGGLEKRTAESAALQVAGVQQIVDDIVVFHN